MPDIAGPGHEWQEEDGVTVLASDLTVTSVRTVCSYCGVGCGMVLDLAADATGARRVVNASGAKTHPANSGRLSTVRSAACGIIRTGPVASMANRETVIVGWMPPNGRRP
jgi:hypothetical protein